MGWARANILFDKVKEMPDTGSPMEMLFLVLWRMRQQIEFQKSRVIIQALLNQQGAEAKHIEDAFKDLRNAFFPFEESQKDEEIRDLKKVMHKELARGALVVKPMADLTRESVKKKLVQGQEEMEYTASLRQTGRLQSLDRDPLLSARRRPRNSASLTETGPA